MGAESEISMKENILKHFNVLLYIPKWTLWCLSALSILGICGCTPISEQQQSKSHIQVENFEIASLDHSHRTKHVIDIFEDDTITQKSHKETIIMDKSLEFELLKHSISDKYLQLRNTVIGDTPNIKAHFQPYLADTDELNQITVKILAGWTDHGSLYTSVLKELNAVNFEKESKTIIGIARIWDMFALRARDEYKEDILPLCWESLLKFHNDLPFWKLITFLKMIAIVPNEESIYPVIVFIEKSNDPSLQGVAADVLLKLPTNATQTKVKQSAAKHGRIATVLQSVLDEIEE